MLAREWRSTASNARARTTQSRKAGSRGMVTFGIASRTPRRVTMFPMCLEVKHLEFKITGGWYDRRSRVVGAPAGAGAGVPGPRGPKGVRGVRRAGPRRRERLHGQPGVQAGPVLGRGGCVRRAAGGCPDVAGAAPARRGGADRRDD